jgi:hypothetical protein
MNAYNEDDVLNSCAKCSINIFGKVFLIYVLVHLFDCCGPLSLLQTVVPCMAAPLYVVGRLAKFELAYPWYWAPIGQLTAHENNEYRNKRYSEQMRQRP